MLATDLVEAGRAEAARAVDQELDRGAVADSEAEMDRAAGAEALEAVGATARAGILLEPQVVNRRWGAELWAKVGWGLRVCGLLDSIRMRAVRAWLGAARLRAEQSRLVRLRREAVRASAQEGEQARGRLAAGQEPAASMPVRGILLAEAAEVRRWIRMPADSG